MDEMRLQVFLAKCGVASRRKCEEYIKQGMVSVNGVIVRDMGIKVSRDDTVEVNGTPVEFESNKVYIMLNKPNGYVTTVDDQFGRPTVIDLVKDINERIFPVGRLDYDTTGLLILTNDGDFTYKMTHPKHEIKKVYVARVAGIISELKKTRFEEGIDLDGNLTAPAKLRILEIDKESSVVEVTIFEGRNRQIRKMFDKIGCPVISLKRVSIGNLHLEDLREGTWRKLNIQELRQFGLS